MSHLNWGQQHLGELITALEGLSVSGLAKWATSLAGLVQGGGRLLVAGNGGSAALAQHLTAELVGRFRRERRPLPALALHAETSSVTAIANDYGFDEVFARQVRAHGRPGDLLLLLSTSGASINLIRAATTAKEAGLLVWALTGALPNPLAELSDEVISVDCTSPPTVQECHLVAIHRLCEFLDEALAVPVSDLAGVEPDRNGADHASEPRTAALRKRPPLIMHKGHAEGQGVSEPERVLLVIGDAFLDRDHVGVARSLYQPTATPVVESIKTSLRPGGAGLAALVAAREPCWQITLLTALGDDEAGQQVRELLGAGGVNLIDVGAGGQTASKSRVMAGEYTVVRFDEAYAIKVGDIPRSAEQALSACHAVLACDYGQGLLGNSRVRELVAAATRTVPVVWDPHARGVKPVPGVTIAVPNAAEAAVLAGKLKWCPRQGNDLGDDIRNGLALLRRWPVGAILVTRADAGAVLLAALDAVPLAIPAFDVTHRDACGAGDRLAVSLAMELGAGAVLSEAVEESVRAATEYVTGGGPAVTGTWMADRQNEPLALARQVRRRGGQVVATAGCFDILHSGHVAMLERAKSLGDCLIVCLNSDDSVRRVKGPGRPIMSQEDRLAMLSALESVAGVVIFGEDTPERVLETLRPDIYVKGGDYAVGEIPERALIESWGGHVVLVPYVRGRSTTSVVRAAAISNRHRTAAAEGSPIGNRLHGPPSRNVSPDEEIR